MHWNIWIIFLLMAFSSVSAQHTAPEQVEDATAFGIPEADYALTVRGVEAQRMAESGKFEEATSEFVAIWTLGSPDEAPSLLGVRHISWRIHMTDLATAHPPAREAFRRLRDESAARMQRDGADTEALREWITLNAVIGDDAALLDWVVQEERERAHPEAVDFHSPVFEELLVRHDRWAALGHLHTDPARAAEEHASTLRVLLKAEARNGARDYSSLLTWSRDSLAALYGGSLAAGREAEAEAIAKNAQQTDDSGAMTAALVRMALRAGEPRTQHARWLRVAANQGEDTTALLKDLDKALRGAPKGPAEYKGE